MISILIVWLLSFPFMLIVWVLLIITIMAFGIEWHISSVYRWSNFLWDFNVMFWRFRNFRECRSIIYILSKILLRVLWIRYIRHQWILFHVLQNAGIFVIIIIYLLFRAIWIVCVIFIFMLYLLKLNIYCSLFVLPILLGMAAFRIYYATEINGPHGLRCYLSRLFISGDANTTLLNLQCWWSRTTYILFIL